MANVDAQCGGKPVRYLNGAPWNGQATRYLIPSTNGTNLFIGDPVTLAGDAGAAGLLVNGIPCAGMPTAIILTAGSGPFLGFIVGFEPNPNALGTIYGPLSTNRVALVADDPNLICEVQEVSGGTALTSAEVGLNANLVAGTGSTATGFSGWELNNSGEAATVSLDVKILRLVLREDNTYGEHAKWEVLVNNHCFRGGVTGL